MKNIGIIVVVLTAIILRFWQLGTVPPSLNADEVAIGYNAYSILKTGKDEYNTKFPLVFRSFDDYKMPVYVYLTVPSIAVFGLTDFAVRFPSAVFGTLTVLFTYLLVMELFHYGLRIKNSDVIKTSNSKEGISNQSINECIALLAAILLTISPWHLQFSRSAYEANGALFFVVLGVYLLFKGLKKGPYFLLASLSLALSVWSYHSSRVFVPLFCIGFGIIFRKELWNKRVYVCIAGILGFCMLLPLIRLSFSKEGQIRAMGVSILSNASIPERMIGWMGVDYANNSLPRTLTTIIHNRRFAYIPSIIKGYFDHYAPNFYFSEIVLEKYHAPGIGLLYVWELPFILYGIYIVFRGKGKSAFLLFWWFLIAPVAASVTEQLPHPVRTLVFLPTFQVFTAVGLASFIMLIGKKKKWMRLLVYPVLSTLILLSFFYYLHQYFIHLPIDYSSAWQYGRKEAVEEVKNIKSQYDEVIVSTSLDVPYIFFLYYLRYDPSLYQKEGGTVSGGFNEDRNKFDVYSFHPIKASIIPNKRILYVGMKYEVPKGATIIQTVHYKNGTDAFYLFTLPFNPQVASKSDIGD